MYLVAGEFEALFISRAIAGAHKGHPTAAACGFDRMTATLVVV